MTAAFTMAVRVNAFKNIKFLQSFSKLLLVLHVFNGSAEGVGYDALVNGLFTQSKIRQFNVTCQKRNQNKTPHQSL